MSRFGEYEQVPSRMEANTRDQLAAARAEISGLKDSCELGEQAIARMDAEIADLKAELLQWQQICDSVQQTNRIVDAWGDQVVSLDEAHAAEIAKYEAVIAQAREALNGVIAEADRVTVGFAKAHAALAAIAGLEVG
jgi:chromosome segregation ATPase